MEDKKLTILMLVTKRQYRGAEISAFNLSKALLAKEHKIIWVGLYSNESHNSVTIDGAINVDLPNSNSWLSIKKIKTLASLYLKYKPDISQANGSDTLRYVVALKLLGYKPKIVYRNISIISKWITSRPKYILSRFLFSHVDKIVSVGDEALADFRSFFPFPSSKSIMIRRGIPISKPSAESINIIRNKYQLKETDFIFIHIGHFSTEKNHDFLLKVWQQLLDKHNDIKLVLLGDGILRESIINEVSLLDLSGSVVLPGLQTSIADWLAISKVMLLCSTVEGVPGVVVEASFQGIPTIAVDVGGVKEVLIDGENGLLVLHHDVGLFVKQCECLLLNRAYTKKLGLTAQTIVKDRFDLDANTNKFIAAYTLIIN